MCTSFEAVRNILSGEKDKSNIWGVNEVSERFEGRKTFVTIQIPNEEIATVYENSIFLWFDKKLRKSDMTPLMTAMEEGDCEAFAGSINMAYAFIAKSA